MASVNGVQERLARASGLPELLDAAYDAFGDLLTVIRRHDEPDGEWFIPMVLAAASAANGRDAVGWAPSLPARRLHREQAEGDAGYPVTAQAAADWVGALCEILAGRLAAAARFAAGPGDRAACRDAARCARDVHALLGGGGR